MTTTLGPGRNTPTRPQHPGDETAKDIRAAAKALAATR